MPERIQLSRKKGWRKPENTVVVARPSKWGNPYKVGGEIVIRAYEDEGRFIGNVVQTVRITPGVAVQMYRDFWMTNWAIGDRPSNRPGPREVEDLRGKNLACWCPLDQPCHADVLLEIANRDQS
ncbi:DUF4326 domain-containing protein [Microbacterium sp. NPDC087592]|uniref:DUF4326 domain-containing protein n=1 Tax=Microbacterium sp. NPDC087592 TaxID=3364193 RepID=UPI003802E40A